MKTTRSRILLGAVLCFAVLGALSASAGVVGWWRFNGEGASVPNVANPGMLDGEIVSVNNDNNSAIAAVDEISFGNDSTKFPRVTSNLQGDAPRIYDPLDGTVHDGGKTLTFEKFKQGGVMVPYNAALDLNNFTVEAMIRLPVGANNRGTGLGSGMFPIVQFGKDQTEGWILAAYNGYLFTRITYKNTSDSNSQLNVAEYYSKGSSFPSLYDGKWHHVAMVFVSSGKTAVCRLFVDGVQYAECRTSTWKSWNFANELPLFIGGNPWQYARTFYGDIAEVRITDSTFSVDQTNNFLVPLTDGQGLADDETALLLTFDNVAKFGFPTNATIATKQTATTSATSTKQSYRWYAKNWNILNTAYNAPTIPHWIVFTNKSDTAILESSLWPTNSADAASALVAFGSSGVTNAILDGGSLSIPTRPTVVSGGATRTFSNLVQLDSGACYFSTNSFTAECFFKIDGDKTDTYTIFYAPFMKLCVTGGNLLLRGYKDGAEGGIGDIKGAVAVNDGKWHHVACVYDFPTKTLTLRQDGEAVGSKTGTALYSGGYQTGSSYKTLGFLIGGQRFDQSANLGSYTGNVQGFAGELDMVRITRRALSPDEFLASAALPDRLLDARFDDDTPPTFSSGLPDYLAPAGTGGTMNGGAAAPALADSRAGSWIFDGVDGTDKEKCGKALSLDGGYVLYPRNRLLERQAFTVEFFARFVDLKKNANFLRFSSGNTLSGAPIWGLYNNVDSSDVSRIYFAATVSADGGLTTTRKDAPLYNLTDNAGDWRGWHHWALTVEPNGARTRYAFYLDGVCVKEPTNVNADGALYFPPEGTCLAIGGTSASGAYLNGLFDNVRITAGVLDPSQFMQYAPGPLVLIVR